MPLTTVDQGLLSTNAQYTGFKNRLINGDMVVDQRNNGASVTITDTSNLTYTLDRWAAFGSDASKFSVQQNAGSVTPPSGFTSYLGVTSLAATSLVSNSQYTISQAIEGFNVNDLGWGTANAQTVTLSFWVRSSLTGTFGGVFVNSALARGYGFTYTISAANTWEQKTITIPGDTTGTWLTNNGVGIRVYFSLGEGASFEAPVGTWSSGSYRGAVGGGSIVSTNGATWQITGVQLERGQTATSFDVLPYGTELALCQRYYVDLANNGGSTQNAFRAIGFGSTYNTTAGTYVVQVPVPMRIVPALTQAGTMYLQNLGSTSIASFAGPYSIAGTIVEGDFNMVAPVTANAPGILRWNNSATQRFAYSAEL
jgi:hypothetical protein